jgi:hypothetical protein
MQGNNVCYGFSIPASGVKKCGPDMDSRLGINAKCIGNKAYNGNKGAWAFLKSHWLNMK